MWLVDILRTAGVLITIYILLVLLRILLTWFQNLNMGKAAYYLCRIVDPYLGLFRRLAFLRRGAMDFSPLAATAVLAIVSALLNLLADSLASGIPLRISNIIIIIINFIWGSIISWLILFFLIICLVRVASLYLSRSPMTGGWSLMDSFIDPLMRPLEKGIERLFRRSVSYAQVLFAGIGLLAVFFLLGNFLIAQLSMVISLIKV